MHGPLNVKSQNTWSFSSTAMEPHISHSRQIFGMTNANFIGENIKVRRDWGNAVIFLSKKSGVGPSRWTQWFHMRLTFCGCLVRISRTRLNVLTVDFRSRAEFPKTIWVMSKTVFPQTPPGLSSPISRLFDRRRSHAAAAQRVTVNAAPLNLVYILRCLVSFQDERSGTIIRPGM